MRVRITCTQLLTIITLLMFVIVSQVSAQIPTAQPITESLVTDQESPRQAVERLLSRMKNGQATRLDGLFDKRFDEFYQRHQLTAVKAAFGQLLDEYVSMPPIGLISNRPEGTQETGLEHNYEKVGDFDLPDRIVPLLLVRITKDDGTSQWLIARETVTQLFRNMPTQHKALISQWLPELLKSSSWRGAPLGQWISVPILATLCYFVSVVLSLLLKFFAIRITRIHKSPTGKALSKILVQPISLVVAVVLFSSLLKYLGVSIVLRQTLSFFTTSILWIAFFMVLWALINYSATRSETYLRDKNRVGGLSILIFTRASAKVLLVIVTVIVLLSNAGVDVTTGLAALGIGGIALALGAQKAIENLVGSIIIIIDQPIRVGDFCKVGTLLGTIEQVGLRSTRIRTLDDTLVTYPNGLLSSEQIENYTKRRKFLTRTTLNLRYETTTSNMEKLLEAMRTQISSYQFTDKESMRVRFIGYGACSLDVEIYVYIIADDYSMFLALQEKLLLSLAKIVEENDSGFAFPSQTVYLTRDK